MNLDRLYRLLDKGVEGNRISRLHLNEINAGFTIRNTVATADLKQPVDIKCFNDYEWGRYDSIFNYNGRVAYVKDRTMKGRVTVFSSGKMISVGARSISESVDQLERAMKLLASNNLVKLVKLKPTVRNIVATMILDGKVDLNAFSKRIPKCIYEPDQFPGIICKLDNGTTCLIFASGKAVIVGARTKNEVEQARALICDASKDFILSYA